MSFQPRGHHHHLHRGAAASSSTLDIDPISPSFMKRVKLALRIPFCFRGHHCINEQDGSPADASPYHDSDTPTGGFAGFPSSNSRPKNHRHGLSGEICMDGYKGAKSRMGRHRRGYSMGDFQYDALSYKLNFEDPGADAGADNADDLRYRSFSTRFSVVGSPRKALHDFS